MSAEETVEFPDFSGKWPFHRRYADARRGLTEVVARLYPAC